MWDLKHPEDPADLHFYGIQMNFLLWVILKALKSSVHVRTDQKKKRDHHLCGVDVDRRHLPDQARGAGLRSDVLKVCESRLSVVLIPKKVAG